ncbi:putative CUB and sushi domain-containing protein 2 [Apostichopus japonicus]|uniref:Putative CUB and sushi domain-containing protein 2 n=1 Tax=Stichopus japonicus TaxID=307972 RepID=A0A2G8KNK5_STIJA|nr:putative CUB and sushi domain-containing protein 2 [Apostichopus japonicus]
MRGTLRMIRTKKLPKQMLRDQYYTGKRNNMLTLLSERGTSKIIGLSIETGISITILGVLGVLARWLTPVLSNQKETSRNRRDTNPSWRYTQYQINALKKDIGTYDLNFCQGNPFTGIQCPEESKCASWDEICDGRQKCALDYRVNCLLQSRLSFGAIDERVCDGDENERWCGWKLQAPQRCGRDYVIKEGHASTRSIRIYSPNWPKRYTDDRFCYWTVQAPEGHRLGVKIKKFKTERNFDFVSIGNGLRYDAEETVIVFKHSGKQKPSQKKFNTKGNQLWISFRSDDWENDKGFYIEVADTLRYDAGVVGRNPFRANKPNKGQVIANNKLSVIGSRIINDVKLCTNNSQWKDYLSVGNGDNPQIRPLLYKHSGRTGPANLTSNENVVWVKFVASLAIARNGFVIKFKDLPYGDCGTEDVTIKTLPRGHTMTISTPDYPANYQNFLNCVYRFQVDEDRRVFVRLLDFASERGYDNFGLGNGFEANEETAVLWDHSDRRLPDTTEYQSDGPVFWVSFRSDMVGTDRGFLLEVYDVPAAAAR